MDNRENIIKFGPEWLRNYSSPLRGNQGASARGTHSGARNTSSGGGGSSGVGAGVGPGAGAAGGSSHSGGQGASRVSLAKLRYGREEMLALYHKELQPTKELRNFELLYVPRGKPPYALDNNFEEDHENSRNGPAGGNTVNSERAGHRGPPVNDRGRGRGTVPPVRQINSRWWRRPTGREDMNEGEWRNDTTRPRVPFTQDKWERDRGDRSNHQHQHWNNPGNRKSRESYEDDANLPEWAIDGPNTKNRAAGSFDAMGAFHGHSNDDSNTPRSPVDHYQMTRSQTHGYFTRNKTPESSKDWWASEKAKKLSPKKLVTSDSGAKVQDVQLDPDADRQNSDSDPDDYDHMKERNMEPDSYNKPESYNNKNIDNSVMYNSVQSTVTQNKTPVSEDMSVESGQLKSVMIANNNSLRQKHQNMVPSSEGAGSNFTLPSKQSHSEKANDIITQPTSNLSAVDKIDHGLFYMHMDNMPSNDQVPTANVTVSSSKFPMSSLNQSLSSGSIYGMTPSSMNLPMSSLPTALDEDIVNQSMQIRGIASDMSLPGLPKQNIGTATSVMSSTGLSTPGITSLLNMSGLPNPGVTGSGLPPEITPFGLSNPRMPGSGISNLGNTPMGPQLTGFSGMGMTPTDLASSSIPSPGIAPNFLPFPGMSSSSLISGVNQTDAGMTKMSYTPTALNAINNSLFLGQTPMPYLHMQDAQERPSDIFPVKQQQQPQIRPSNASIFNTVHMPPTNPSNQNIPDTWMYKDPEGNTQGPFSSKEMLDWYQAGFFTPELLIRRSCDIPFRPLWSYGPVPPFMVMNVPHSPVHKPDLQENNIANNFIRSATNTMLSQQPIPDSWRHSAPSPDMWMPHSGERVEQRVNLLEMFKWDQPPMQENPVPEPLEQVDDSKTSQNMFPSPLTETTIPFEPKQVIKPIKIETVEKIEQREIVLKTKTKGKVKEDKKEEPRDFKAPEEDIKTEKRQNERKEKKEDKNKKEIETDTKGWLKVTNKKVAEKPPIKETKKTEDIMAQEEVECKRKEEEKLQILIAAAEEEKKRKEAQKQQTKFQESLVKKAPWSAVADASQHAVNKEGLTLAEIQKMEREKKLEQMKEQQQMMQVIAQKQQAALAREQEMQSGMVWSRNKSSSMNPFVSGPSLSEIQAETRKQATATSVPLVVEEPSVINYSPWGAANNAGGFWDTEPGTKQKTVKVEKPADTRKNIEQEKVNKNVEQANKNKKKPNTAKQNKPPSPLHEFEIWCTTVLASWSGKVDVPTFIEFLKDIESPYEVKDYVKDYLGETKESGDFARQYIERRSKILRAGAVVLVDDLCSPAAAINPRSINTSADSQEIKNKSKKTKKNKMTKLDKSILGFSVTASEDRINVGDIDNS